MAEGQSQSKEVSEEHDSAKIDALSKELIRALDKEADGRAEQVTPSDKEDGQAEVRRGVAMDFYLHTADWKSLYEAALLETDTSKLSERITAARSAIFDRIEESLTHPLPSEHRAMDDALRNLRRLATTSTPRRAA